MSYVSAMSLNVSKWMSEGFKFFEKQVERHIESTVKTGIKCPQKRSW